MLAFVELHFYPMSTEKSTRESGLLIRMLEKSNEKPIESAEKKNPS